LLAGFVDQRLQLDEALRLTALAARDSAVAAASARAADDVAAGASLAKSLERSTVFSPSLRTFATWGSEHGALADALRAARRLFEDRFALQVQLMRLILPPIAFLILASSILVVVRLMGSAISLLTDLV
jgi:type II secretory pathway component PulF